MEYKNPLSGYVIKKETLDSKKKKEYWSTGIGLNAVDSLIPSEYLLETAKKHIDGKISSIEVDEQLRSYYSKADLTNNEVKKQLECDMVSKRIVDLLDQGSFTFSPQMLKGIHKYLFDGINESYKAGEFRKYNITKAEPILNGNTVNYGNYFMIDELFKYDFNEEKKYKYSMPFDETQVKHLSQFISSIWQIHPFCEGNTRTTAVFTELYLRNMGVKINNDLFKEHAVYFRGALVRSNYANVNYGISPSDEYLIKFFDNLLNIVKDKFSLNSEDLKCKDLFERKEESHIDKACKKRSGEMKKIKKEVEREI